MKANNRRNDFSGSVWASVVARSPAFNNNKFFSSAHVFRNFLHQTSVIEVIKGGSRKIGILGLGLLIAATSACDSSNQGSPSANSSGQGGSLSRFAVSGDHLYVISGSAVKIFDISVPDNIAPWSQFFVEFDIETLRVYRDKLFIGGRRGVYIYDNADPASPKALSEFTHGYACDPVVVQGDYAYLTLRSDGGGCRRMANNTLEVLDIKDVKQPRLVESILMYHPGGLAVDGVHLFVCDGAAGLKRFDISNPSLPVIAQTWKEEQCDDLIAGVGHLVSVGKSGLTQWDYASDPIKLLGAIAVVEK